ncbi:peptidylprolyl isomerase [Vibrio sp. 404]|uniref:Peptidyl-prolyl cis-trans isomerase n=1 Tax=Vibrio marinisediminis TaxID=2758441 RepID=A0A7W2IUJ3_9VIBR|nr:peptidylprolyl isomerase [Vibrio marinisediminis]MBA5763313.1 peptidylprolyl isomerase [Vibrio marinisediminis]
MWKYAIACAALISNLAFAGPKVEMETNVGSFVIELNEQQAPTTVANFLKYVKDGSYVGTQFHRVIPGFMAQGGGFDSNMNRAATYPPIRNEANNGLKNNAATIAMARTNEPNSATRQFFINLVDNDFLNGSARSAGYAVFGEVTQGFDVVQQMATKPTHTVGRYRDVPVDEIIIERVTLLD